MEAAKLKAAGFNDVKSSGARANENGQAPDVSIAAALAPRHTIYLDVSARTEFLTSAS